MEKSQGIIQIDNMNKSFWWLSCLKKRGGAMPVEEILAFIIDALEIFIPGDGESIIGGSIIFIPVRLIWNSEKRKKTN
jgi:hypothetical protein